MKNVFLLITGTVILYGCFAFKTEPQDVVYHKVGEKFGGGVVFFIRGNGEHGLIAATEDQGKGVTWMKGADFKTKDGVGSGRRNAKIIMKYNGPVPNISAAAKLCNEYFKEEGLYLYDDWYLPSKLELSILYQNKDLVGGFSNKHYWTSTVNEDGETWFQDFGNGRQDVNVAMPSGIRAIRTF